MIEIVQRLALAGLGAVLFGSGADVARASARTLRVSDDRAFAIRAFTVSTNHQSYGFNFYVPRAVEARWLSAAMRIAHWRDGSMPSAGLYDEPPNGPNGTPGDELNFGVLEWDSDREALVRRLQATSTLGPLQTPPEDVTT